VVSADRFDCIPLASANILKNMLQVFNLYTSQILIKIKAFERLKLKHIIEIPLYSS
jgi:hypothetical protein